MIEGKTIERCEELIKPEHANWIGISNQEAIRELLNILKEKDKEIEKLQEENETTWKLNENMSKRHLNDVCKIKNDEKQIDLMAEHIQNGCDFDNRIKTKEEIKQYFKSKETNDG